MELSTGHGDTEVLQTSILEPTNGGKEWEAVWNSHQPTETDDTNSSVPGSYVTAYLRVVEAEEES